jgi:mono/diheme cytochrome c family protein
MSLVTRADLMRVSTRDPNMSFAERAVLRMRDTNAPMPPGSAQVPESEIAAFDAWIASGMPLTNCGTEPPPDPFDTPVQCTSGRTWPARGDEGPEMHPGRACISCHTAEREGPTLWLGGTVYPTAHEPNDCFGVDGETGAVVEITDAEGRVFRLIPNANGNFLLANASEQGDYDAPFTGSFAYPYRARVLFEGRERAMGTAQMTGDCNGCHTVEGTNGAPGRILLP